MTTKKIRARAAEYSQSHVKRLTHTTDRLRAEKSFLDGLEAFKTIMDKESNRICAIIETSVAISDFERGQADGVRWLVDAISHELGFR